MSISPDHPFIPGPDPRLCAGPPPNRVAFYCGRPERDHPARSVLRSQSRVTGTMTVPGLLGDQVLQLRDNATAVPVADRYEMGAMVTYRRGDGRLWETFCHCGPAATGPDAPPAIGPAGVPLWVVEAHPEATGWEQAGDPGLRRWRAKVPAWSPTLPPADLLVVTNAGGTRCMKYRVDLVDRVDAADTERRVWENLAAALAHEELPGCEAPGCFERAPTTFTTLEPGQLAGRQRNAGDRVVFCPEHAYDVIRAGYRVDEVAEWLRPDMDLQDFPARINTAYDQHAGIEGPDRRRVIRVQG